MFPNFDFLEVETDEEIDEDTVTTLGRVMVINYINKKLTVSMEDGKPKEASTETEKIESYANVLLRTASGKFEVYEDTDFGVTYFNYLGRRGLNVDFIKSELKREIESGLEALGTVDSVTDFDFSLTGTTLNVTFTVNLVDGTSTEITESVVI